MSGPGALSVWRRLGVLLLTAALAAASVGATQWAELRWDPSALPFTVPWWALAVAYFATYRLPLRYQRQRESRELFLTHVALVIGLVFVGPWWHLLAKGLAMATHTTTRRQPPMKVLFNTSLGLLEAAVAIVVLSVLAPRPDAHAALWGAILVALLAAEVAGAAALQCLLTVVGVRPSPRVALRIVATGWGLAVLFGLVTVIFVAAAWTDPWSLVAIVVVAAALVVGYQRHQTLTERARQSEELQRFVQTLGPLDLAAPGSVAVLGRVREMLHASRLELALRTGTGWHRVVALSEGQGEYDEQDGDSPFPAHLPSSAALESSDLMRTPLVGGSGLLGVLSVHDRFGGAPFDLQDLRQLESLAVELTSALERGRLQHELALAATTDPLTGLPNLIDVQRRLDGLLATYTTGVIVSTIAVESFREVNDTLGHEVGDELLVEVTRRLRISYPRALLGRIGGGRFAVCIPVQEFAGDAALFGLGIRAQVEGGAQLGPVGTHVRLAVGCVEAPEHGGDAATLIRRAETAMYGARHSGGGPVVWEPVYEVEGQRRLAVVMALREAVASGAIGVAYQPKVHARSDEVVGVEALARWTHPALGAISPAEFVPLAEAAGLMGPLTSLVLRQALTTCKGWQRRGGPIGVSVNVSAGTLLDATFAHDVATLLVATDVAPELLTLELTEGVVVGDPELAATRMHELRRLGVKLSVDDFGTGYSSLTYLKGLPVDEVKIDKGFVDHVTTDPGDRAVVRAVVDIAHTLGLSVVAEGVERADQLRTLRELGVDEAQGYLLARPMPSLEIGQWLRRRAVSPHSEALWPGDRRD